MIHSFCKGAFLREDPTTDLWPQIMWILHQKKKQSNKQTNKKSEKGLFWYDNTGWRHAIFISDSIRTIFLHYCPRIRLEWKANNLETNIKNMARQLNLHGRPLVRCTIFESFPQENLGSWIFSLKKKEKDPAKSAFRFKNPDLDFAKKRTLNLR